MVLEIIRKYDKWSCSYKKKNLFKYYFFMELPHLIVVLALIYFFPKKWLGIIILGIILPDLFLALH